VTNLRGHGLGERSAVSPPRSSPLLCPVAGPPGRPSWWDDEAVEAKETAAPGQTGRVPGGTHPLR